MRPRVLILVSVAFVITCVASHLYNLDRVAVHVSTKQEAPGFVVRMCIVGHVRTFALEPAYESIYKCVYQALLLGEETENNVDVSFVLTRSDISSNGANMGAQTYVDEEALQYAISIFHPSSVRMLSNSSCAEYKRVWETSTCVESAGFFQLANIHQCFTESKRLYSHYVRVRPDSFFAARLPPLASGVGLLETWLKADAPASDQFFLFSRDMFISWWNKTIVRLLSDPAVRDLCCPEYTIFNDVAVHQNFKIQGCLLRTPFTLQCWRGEHLESIESMGIVKALASRLNCTSNKSVASNIVTIVDSTIVDGRRISCAPCQNVSSEINGAVDRAQMPMPLCEADCRKCRADTPVRGRSGVGPAGESVQFT